MSGRRGNTKMIVGGVIVTVFVLSAALAPLITSGAPDAQNLLNRLAIPTIAHPLGTDELGRDVWTRLVYAIRLDLRVGVLGALLPALLGCLIGIISGFARRWLDTSIMRLTDIIVSFPLFIFFLSLVGLVKPGSGWWIFGPGELPILAGFTLLSWVVYARLMRSEIRRVRGMPYVTAAITGGLPMRRVVVGHVLPNAIGQMVVYVFVDVGLAIVALSTLSFLGIGIPVGTAEWGSMINSSRGFVNTSWWLVAAPGAAVALLATGLALVGDGLDDRMKSS